MKRTLATVIAAVTIAGGLAACTSDGGSSSDGSGDASATTGAEASGGADASASDSADSSDSADASESEGATDGADAEGEDAEGANGAEGADGETVEQQTADGQSVLIPADFKSAIDEVSGEWGDPESIQQEDNGALATFAEENLLAWSEDSGAAPLVGMIGQTWADQGGLTNEIGLPTAPEETLPDGGWTQTFTNGVINWVNEGGEWTAQVEPN
ncbi:LGFP repeat-containing protein [Corynebacterium lubricantis]|uniref:LGFP repeat-containing protein n=1 Tax=Corynebacterium lubricantis TaxID=541095 RepID=UPI00036E3BB2|nr:hypothetical protein [Corynebacterium lubricantis]